MKNNLVVLVNPGHDDEVPEEVAVSYGARFRKIRRECPPTITNLGGFIRDHGYEVIILDTHIEPDYKARLKELIGEEPLVIGFSVILGKFTKNAITLTRMIKEINGNIPVVWGGKLVSLAKEIILEQTDVDFLVLGDGEFPFLNLLDSLKKNKDYRNIPGIGYKENGKTIINITSPVENLDRIYVSKDFGWDLIKQQINVRQVPYFVNLCASRGCKFNCAFCYLQDIKQHDIKYRFRQRSAENIIKEIDYLHNTYGVNVVTFSDDNFLCNISEMVPVLDYLRKRNIYIEYLFTHISYLRPETIELLAGICQTVLYAIETVSPRLQKIINKVIYPERIIEVNKQLREVGITTEHSFMFGIPTETDEETKANIDLLKKLKEINPYVRVGTSILSPIPDTPIFEFAKELVGVDIEWDMEYLKDFHWRFMGRSASKYRPYLKPDDNLFYETVSKLTNELFLELNTNPTEEQLREIQNDKRLSYIFGDVNNINKPKDQERKYILDLVLEAMDNGLPMPKIRPF
ncbi:B12-binding domain-containing radical SAM protein [Chloroflexota bacterium]